MVARRLTARQETKITSETANGNVRRESERKGKRAAECRLINLDVIILVTVKNPQNIPIKPCLNTIIPNALFVFRINIQ